MKPQVTSSLPSPLGALGKFRYSIQYLWNRIGLSALHRCVTTLLYKTACKCLVGSEVHPEYPVFILVGVLAPNRATFCQPTHTYPTSRKYAFLPCGQLDFESAVTEQNDEFKAVLIARIHARLTLKRSQETHYLASTLSDTFVKCICRSISCALGKWSFHSSWNLYRL